MQVTGAGFVAITLYYTFQQDVPPTTEEIEKALRTKKTTPPHLVALKDAESNKLKRVFVVGNGTYIPCKEGCTIRGAYVNLMAIYFVFQLQYPTIYCGALGMLQTHFFRIGDYALEGGFASAGYKRLSGNVKKAVAKIEQQKAKDNQK